MDLKHLLFSRLSARHAGPARRRFALRLVAVAALAVVIAVAFPSGAAQAKAPDRWVAGELLVGLRAGVGPTRAQGLFRAHGATVLSEVGQIRIVRVRVPVALMDMVERLFARLPEVKFVEKNYIFDPVFVPDDPMYAAQWHLPQILAPQAWDLTQGSPGAVIAIVDSGVDPYHPDLAPNQVAGYNTYNNNTNTLDQYGHGTEVAGVAAASSNNGQGVASVAGQSRIMPVRVTDATGRATSATIANGLVWAADHGASVMNLSFEGVAGNATIRSAAEYALNHGALVVAASGNCGCFDATADNPFILSVSATDETGGIAYFSSTGPYVDLAAPGTNILTTAVGGLYFSDSGTSLASPVVAGVAALMFSANPALTPTVVTELLEATAFDAGGAGYDHRLRIRSRQRLRGGHGRGRLHSRRRIRPHPRLPSPRRQRGPRSPGLPSWTCRRPTTSAWYRWTSTSMALSWQPIRRRRTRSPGTPRRRATERTRCRRSPPTPRATAQVRPIFR